MSAEQNPPDKQTDYLEDLPRDAEPMAQREPSPNTAMLSTAWHLHFKIGEKTRVVPVSDQIVVGRVADEEQDGDIDFNLAPYGAYHYGVSRRHAEITLHGGYLYLADMGSTNGTRINGFQLTPRQKYRLRDRDELEFGRLRMVIQFESPDED